MEKVLVGTSLHPANPSSSQSLPRVVTTTLRISTAVMTHLLKGFLRAHHTQLLCSALGHPPCVPHVLIFLIYSEDAAGQ